LKINKLMFPRFVIFSPRSQGHKHSAATVGKDDFKGLLLQRVSRTPEALQLVVGLNKNFMELRGAKEFLSSF